jgi:hypothetical protein
MMTGDPAAIWNANEAADVAIIATHPTAGSKILIFGLDGKVALDLDRGLAVALAARLTELAQQVEEPRTIRRHPDTDDRLREVEN